MLALARRLVLLPMAGLSGVRLSYIIGSVEIVWWLAGVTVAGRSLCGQADRED
jgi:hypothetical protein